MKNIALIILALLIITFCALLADQSSAPGHIVTVTVVSKYEMTTERSGGYDDMERPNPPIREEHFYLYASGGFAVEVSGDCYYSVNEGDPLRVFVSNGQFGTYYQAFCP